MKVECSKEKLERALTLCERATSKNPTLPILAYVLIESSGSNLVFRATNLDISFEVSIPAKVEKPGISAIKGTTLLGFISNTPKDKSVSMELVDGGMVVKVPGGEATLKTVSHEDFPKISKSTKEPGLVLDAISLSSGIRSVAYSASVSHIKPELSSVVIYSDGKAGMVI